MSCSGPEASASPPETGLQLARPALVLRSVRLSGGLFRMSRSEPRLTSSVLFCAWRERSSGLFHTPSAICLCKCRGWQLAQEVRDGVKKKQSWKSEQIAPIKYVSANYH